ncbi:MAG: UDP-N-acetylmuramate--L-alanine ligase [Alphaproteobacteria bacterium]|nr:UDP-N-acetylmuramate--L-alanine ligase [Alphaproteobacteria bacterium]
MELQPFPVGTLHFVGIGGIGMSGIAEVLHNLGYKVQGSDLSENYNTARLKKLGVRIFISHDAKNVQDEKGEECSAVIISSAVKSDNPELTAARELKIPVVRRADMLGELMKFKSCVAVAGTHGKTTTTSMVAHLLEAGGLDPTVINGGIINAYGTNAKLGASKWMVAESDESDGSFLRLPATIAIVTNIDPEHMEHYGSFDVLKKSFRDFVENLPFYGFAVMCTDHPVVKELVETITDRRIVTYGFQEGAQMRAVNLRTQPDGFLFDIEAYGEIVSRDIHLPLRGQHNVLNGLAAMIVANEIGVNYDTLKESFAAFEGVKRRFTITGVSNGVTIVDDYGHHPVEIEAVLSAGRQALEGTNGRIIAVVQPHRYSRVQGLLQEFATCFAKADIVVVADIYAAGEQPVAGINKETLAEKIRAAGHKNVMLLPDAEALAPLIKDIAAEGDMVICLGAGNITQWANKLPAQLGALAGKSKKLSA